MFRVMVPWRFCGSVLHYGRKGRCYKTLEAASRYARRHSDAYVIDDRGVLVDYPTKPKISKCINAFRKRA